MGMVEEVGERMGIGAGWVIGIAIATVALLGPSLGKGLRPATKRALRGFMAARDRAKETLAETSERLQDVYEEARLEYDASHVEHEVGESPAHPARHEESARSVRASRREKEDRS